MLQLHPINLMVDVHVSKQAGSDQLHFKGSGKILVVLPWFDFAMVYW